MVDYRALATTSVAMVELRRGKLGTEKAMRAHRSSAVAANLKTVKWRGWRSAGRSCLAGDTETRARARRSNGGDAETTTHARWREPGVEWHCPRDRGRRGELKDARRTDERGQRRRTDATSPDTRQHRRAPPV